MPFKVKVVGHNPTHVHAEIRTGERLKSLTSNGLLILTHAQFHEFKLILEASQLVARTPKVIIDFGTLNYTKPDNIAALPPPNASYA